MKDKKITILFMIFILLLIFTAARVAVNLDKKQKESASQVLLNNRHTCEFSKCPYKGITVNEWNSAVINYTETEPYSDAWCVDMIHLQNPTWGYDKIDSVLFR